MDLSAIYSKTPKGLRARASLIGGLSSHLMKVLTHVDGSSRAENILLKFDKLTPQQLSADLARLEQEGYIRLATVSTAPDDSWALTINFEPMVVEEYQSEEELEAVAQAQKAQQARQLELQQAEQQAEQLAQQEEKRLAEAQKAEKKLQKLREKEKAKAESKVKAQLEEEKQEQEIQEKQRQELERTALEAARREAEAEAKLKAQQEAERIEQQQAAERAAKLAEEARLKAELKAREAAEQAEAEAEAAAKEDARREIERISRESEEAQKKAEAEAKAKLEAELAAQQEAEAKALAEASAREAAAQEKIRQETAEAEAAAKAKLEAELAAQREAERKAQAEAEQIRIEAEAKVEAEKAAREAAEQEKIRQETAEAEAAAKAKAAQDLKEKARLEIANVLRKAEEDRKKAAAQAKEQKLEAKRQAKAEQEAQLQAERKSKEEAKQKKLKALADEKVEAEAAEIAHKNALEEGRKQAEAARLAADLLAKTELEQREATLHNEELIAQQTSEALRASLAAEEQANLAAKEQARLEMERIGREAELVRQRATAEQHVAEVKKGLPNKGLPSIDKPNSSLPMLDDFDAAEAAEEAAFHEEEQAEEAVEKIQRTIATTTGAITTSAITTSEKATKPLAESAGRVEIRNAAIAQAAAMASVHGKALSFVSAKKIKQWLKSLSKVTFIYVPVLVLLMLVLLHFVNLSSLIKPIEQLATESVGEPVAIKKVHASLWPQPHLVLEQIVIGTSGSINSIHVLPETTSLFVETKVVKSLVIEGLNIEQADFGRPLQWASNVSKAKNLKVEQINLKNLMLAIRDLQLESFDGKVTLTDTGAVSAIDLVSSNNALSVMISPQGSDYAITLQAANWTLPFNQKMMFSTLNAKGVASNNQINFYQIKGEIYGGNMIGQANIQWPNDANQWESAGNFTLTNANAEQLLNTFGSAVIIDGKLALEGSFSGKAREASKLTDAAIFNANFDVRHGSIKGVELASAVINRSSHSLTGDSTDFDKLTGSIKINQDQYQFSKLVLTSSQFNANGYININANQILTGRINADLAAQSRRLQANFAITGRGKDLKSQ
jgi:hypothetical protein